MKNLRGLAVIFFLLALDWLALHDILKGHESRYFSEYSMFVGSIPLLVLSALWLLKPRVAMKRK